MSVRNENNQIIQFLYGGDNFCTTKVEKQKFELVKYNNQDFEKKYKWTNEEIMSMNKEKSQRSLNKEYTELKKMRKYAFEHKYQYRDGLYYPMNIFRIVKQSISKFGLENNTETDLEPKYILKRTEELLKEIRVNQNTEYPYDEMNDFNYKILRTMIKSKLATKIILYENKLTTEAFDWVINNITDRFYKALIHPGTNIGIICASSVGEPCTQMSVRHNTKVKVNIDGKYQEPKIGKLIDDYMNNMSEKVIQTHITEDGKPSHILPITKDMNIRVPGLDYKTQQVKWRRVTEFSRHPVNGKLIRIRTKSGKTVIATPSHSFVVKGLDGKPKTIRGDKLVLGDNVPLMRCQNKIL